MAATAAAKKKKAMAMKKAMQAAATLKSTGMKAIDDAAKTKKMMKTKKTTKAKNPWEEADAAKIAMEEAMKRRDLPNDPLEVRMAENRRILDVMRAYKDALLARGAAFCSIG